ncbi:MAG: radical SAM protein [Candidatus Aenigmarchaeota archaeon]|nr:radical SAM protein [Candidatus Aenigmarchaeota archaeon]
MVEKEAIDRIIEWAKGRKAPPHKVLIYPTNKCNLKCPFCFLRLNPYSEKKEMSRKRWMEITQELCKMGVDILQISGGGEPLVRKEVTLKMMKIIKSYGKTGRLVNNGTLWKEKDVKKVVEMKWDNVIFSLDGPSPEINDKSRGVKGTFDEIVKNIKLFAHYKKLFGSEKPMLEFSTVLTKINYKEIAGLIKSAHDLEVKNITIEPVFVSNPDVKKLKLNEKQRRWFIERIPYLKELADSLSISTNLVSLQKVGSVEKTGNLRERILGESKPRGFLDLPCYEPWIWPKIEANGEVGPCSTIFLSNVYRKEISVKSRSFKDVWYGKEFEDFRRHLLEGKITDACSNCVSTHIPTNKMIREEIRKLI